jgi:hypothetical protein
MLAFLHEMHLARRAACFIFAGLLVVASSPCPSQGANPPGATIIRGEVVDTACFVMGNRHGELHRQCAIACARAGQSLGIVDQRTKKLYLAILDARAGAPANPLFDHIAARVEVRGTVLERGGLLAIEIQSVHRLSP